MFWNYVLGGLRVLTFWQTYVAAVEYLAIFMVPMGLVGLRMAGSESRARATGCLGMLLLPALQVAAVAVFILTLAPIILGLSDSAAWSFPWTVILFAPVVFLKLLGVLVVAFVLLAFVPFLGQLASLQTLVQGAIVLIFALAVLRSGDPALAAIRLDVVPGFWLTLGILVVGALMSWVGIMVAALAATFLEATNEGLGQFITIPLGALFGFLPVFIYGAWLGAQLKGGP
jgi:hypothetical protein